MVGPILIGGAVLVAAVLLWGPVSARLAANALREECGALRSALAAASVQGADVGVLEGLRAQLAECRRRLKAAGEEVDESGDVLAECEATRAKMWAEFNHFKSTDYADIVKRGNTRAAILRLGEDMARCYGAAIDAARSAADLDRIIPSISAAIDDSEARLRCYEQRSPGCDRYFGSVEDDPASKANAERVRVRNPLVSQRQRARDKLVELAGAAGDSDPDLHLTELEQAQRLRVGHVDAPSYDERRARGGRADP